MSTIYQEIEAQRKLAKEYLLAGRYDDAITQAQAILIDLAILPDGEKSGDAGASLQFDRKAILDFIEVAKKARADAALSDTDGLGMGMTTHPMVCHHERPTRGGSHRG